MANKRKRRLPITAVAKSSGVAKLNLSRHRRISLYHTSLKQLRQAKLDGDNEKTQSLTQELEQLGGISGYQAVSKTGQDVKVGGDSSKRLVEWLNTEPTVCSEPIRVLEVGCLSPDNAIARRRNTEVERIDLHSAHASVAEQDFLERPIDVCLIHANFC